MHITDRFHDSKWGVLTHYLSFVQNKAGDLHNQGVGETPWDECVDNVDVELIADTVASTGASYLFFTMEQGTRYIIAPNKTYDRIVGGGENTGPSKRDLVLDLHKALSKRGVDLYLYFTGSGPADDPEHGPKFGFSCGEGEVVTRPFVEKWAAVLEEYSRRYGDKVKGWWIDGCYREMFGFTDELLDLLYYAAKAGNKNAIVALNEGVDIPQDVRERGIHLRRVRPPDGYPRGPFRRRRAGAYARARGTRMGRARTAEGRGISPPLHEVREPYGRSRDLRHRDLSRRIVRSRADRRP